MSYRVDSANLLFDDLTYFEAGELDTFARAIVLIGLTDMQHPAFVSWLAATEYGDSRALLVYTTVFPQRALLSLVNYWKPKT